MRLDVDYKGQPRVAVRKVAAVLSLGSSSACANDENLSDDDASPPPEQEQEQLVYPRSRLTTAARAALLAARIARTRAKLLEDDDENQDERWGENDVTAMAAAAARAAETAAAEAVEAAMASSRAEVAGKPEPLHGFNPNSAGHNRLQSSSVTKSSGSVFLDPVPPEIPRPLRIGVRTYRPGAQAPPPERGSKGSIRRSHRSQTKPSHTRDRRSRQVPGWQQTSSSAPRVTGQTKVTEYAYVVDTGALAVDGVRQANPPAAVQQHTVGAARASLKTRGPAVRPPQQPGISHGSEPPGAIATSSTAARVQPKQVNSHTGAGPNDDQEMEPPPQQDVHQQPAQPAQPGDEGHPEHVADVAETADKAWTKMQVSQTVATFTPKQAAKRSKKLRQIIQYWYMQEVRVGLVELRDVLASDPFSAVINSGESIIRKLSCSQKEQRFIQPGRYIDMYSTFACGRNCARSRRRSTICVPAGLSKAARQRPIWTRLLEDLESTPRAARASSNRTAVLTRTRSGQHGGCLKLSRVKFYPRAKTPIRTAARLIDTSKIFIGLGPAETRLHSFRSEDSRTPAQYVEAVR